jgi:hypothetical protein
MVDPQNDDVNKTIKAAHYIVLAIVGLTVVNSIFVILLDIYANVSQDVFQMPHHHHYAKRYA